MIYTGNRGSSHFAFRQLILVVHLRRGRLFSHRGHSSVHSLQPLVQFISLAEVEPDGLFLSLALQTVADAFLKQNIAGAFFFSMLCWQNPQCNETNRRKYLQQLLFPSGLHLNGGHPLGQHGEGGMHGQLVGHV